MSEREDVSEALAAHVQAMGSNDGRVWNFCRCNPDVELAAHDGPDVPPAGDDFYFRCSDAASKHVAEALLASSWLAAHDERVRAEALAPVRVVLTRMEHRNVDHRHPDEVGHWGVEGRAYYYAGDIIDDIYDLRAALPPERLAGEAGAKP